MDAEVKATIVSPEQTVHAHHVCDVSTDRKSGCTATAHDCGRPRRGDWGEARSVPRRRGRQGGGASVQPAQHQLVCPAREPGHQEEGERTCSLHSSRGAENSFVDAWAEKRDPGWASRQR